MIVFVILTGVITSLLEGGTIGLFAIAVDVLINGAQKVFEYLESIEIIHAESFFSSIQGYSREVVFVALILAAVAFQLLKSCFVFVYTVLVAKLRRRTSARLQQSLTRKCLSLRFVDVIERSVGDMLERIRLGDATSRVVLAFAHTFRAIMIISAYVVISFMVSAKMTLMAVFFGVLVVGSIKLLTTVLRRYGAEATTATLELGKITVDMLSAPRLIRVLNIQNVIEKKLRTERNRNLRAGEKIAIANGLISPMTDFIVVLVAGISLLGVFIYAPGQISNVMADLIVLVVILNRLLPQAQAVIKFPLVVATQEKNIERIGHLVSLEEERPSFSRSEGSLAFSSQITLCDVGYSYPKAKNKALSKIDLTVSKGEFVTVVGPSGSGKTTLVDIVAGLLEVCEGRVIVDGKDLGAEQLPSWRCKIGMVEQNTVIINGTLRENILFGRADKSDEEFDRALSLAAAQEFVSGLDRGLDTIVGEGGIQLSGGEAQRIGLARALLGSPEILVLDEYTSALDPDTRSRVDSSIRNLSPVVTTIRLTHDMSSVFPDDRVVVLDRGRIVQDERFHRIGSLANGTNT